MFHGLRAGARSRAAGLFTLALAAGLLSACGSDESPSPPAAQAPASRLVVDTGTAAPAQGGTLTLKATLLGADGQEVKGAKFAWSSSNEAVAVVISASDQAPAAASMMQPVGTYASVRMLAPGEVDIVATATLPDGSQATSTTHLAVQAPAAKTYALALSPSTLTVNYGAAAQVVTAVVRRSDGVDGAADLTNWSWNVDNATFAAVPAADSHSAQVSTTGTLAGTGQLTACASTPAGDRLCANAALARPLVALPSIAFSVPSLNVKPGRTGTVTATLTDGPGADLASRATLAWSIQQSGTAASIVSMPTSTGVMIGLDAAQTGNYAATLTLTATYPDGRTNSSTLPLTSTGAWSRLPDAPIASPSLVSLAIDGTRVWRLTADGSQPARLERFGVAGDGPAEPAAALPAAAQGMWLAADTDPANSAVVVQLGADGASVPFGSFDAAFANPRADFTLTGCAQYAASPTAGRAFVKATGGTGIVSAGWCVTSGAWWWQPVGGGATVNNFIRAVPILEGRPFPGGGGLAIEADGSRYVMQSDGSQIWDGSVQAPLAWGAVSSGAIDENAPLYGYVGGNGIVVSPGSSLPYVTFVPSAPPLIKLSAIPHFVIGLPASWSALVVANTDGTTPTMLALPGNAFGLDFAGAVDANGKLRIAARLADGSVWVYDQP
ncbi:hypothetical protein [Cupriavidus basilensis]|uniref:hypothetical protein n=1 Tax=Cupriavidus basilensis TaxID=68895 RepID=UPI000751A060|nr:hypothetical protein [Cupriavidus basilensis]